MYILVHATVSLCGGALSTRRNHGPALELPCASSDNCRLVRALNATDLVILQALDCEHGGQMASCELDLFRCDASLLPSCVAFQLCVGNKLNVCGDCPLLLALTCTPKIRGNGHSA